MGEIFLAKSGELSGFEKLCVIKKVLPQLAADTEFIRRFVDEAQVAIKLSNVNIAPVFEVGMVDGEYFLALEYVEGRDLRRMLARLHDRKERMPADMALWIVRELASGLAYAHRRTDAQGRPLNLVHCDISPPNVIVSFEGEVKIIDFGIAKSAMHAGVTNPAVGFGKLGYMAPEQLVAGVVVDRRADVYASGVLLYELLMGERLFTFPEGTDFRAMAQLVISGRHPLPSQRDPQLAFLDALVGKALAADREHRFQVAEDLRDAVQTALTRLNPTLSADRVGTFVRRLFADEIVDERTFIQQASEADLTPFVGELTQTQTIVFAKAGAQEPAPFSTGQERSGTVPVLRANVPARQDTRRVGVWALAVGIVLVAVAVVLAIPTRKARIASHAPVAVPSVADVSPAAPPPAVPEPLPTLAAPPVRPIAKPPRKVDPNPVSADAVQGKFMTVQREYSRFKKEYGARLDEDWNDILDLATFGTGDEKMGKLNSKLDHLRRKMAVIRSGG
jgi:serine/threonine-protein kinase